MPHHGKENPCPEDVIFDDLIEGKVGTRLYELAKSVVHGRDYDSLEADLNVALDRIEAGWDTAMRYVVVGIHGSNRDEYAIGPFKTHDEADNGARIEQEIAENHGKRGYVYAVVPMRGR